MQKTLMMVLLLLCRGGSALNARASLRQVDSDQSQQQVEAGAENAGEGASVADSIRPDLLLAALQLTIKALQDMNRLVDELNAAAAKLQNNRPSYVLPTPGIYTIPGKKSLQSGGDGNSAPNLSAAVCNGLTRRLLFSDNSEHRQELKKALRRCQNQAA